jgi:hypothetical protein
MTYSFKKLKIVESIAVVQWMGNYINLKSEVSTL